MQILNAAEEREKQVVGLEEELARRRRDLEHEHSTRLAEAEATVRRLQVPLSLPSRYTFHCPLQNAEKVCHQAFRYLGCCPPAIHSTVLYTMLKKCAVRPSDTKQLQVRYQASTKQIQSRCKTCIVHDQGMGIRCCDVLCV